MRLVADYDSHALWLNEPGAYENIPPDRLGLSGELVIAIDKWSEEYDQTLNRDDPLSSGFASEEIRNDFFERGLGLARQIKNELGNNWRVSYFDPRDGQDVEV